MRTYFKFLSRNKLYTFVTIVGFALSLIFVLLLSFYVRREQQADRIHTDYKRIYQYNVESKNNWSGFICCYPAGTLIREQVPDVEEICRISEYNDKEYIFIGADKQNGLIASHLSVESNFFTFFDGYKLLEGDPKTVLSEQNSTVISSALAARIFGNMSPIGQEISFFDFSKNKQTFRITGIMEPMPDNCHIRPAELLFYQEPKENNYNNANYALYLKAREGADLTVQLPAVQKAVQGKDVIFAFDEKAEVKLHPLEKCYPEPLFPNEYAMMVQKGNPARTRILIAITLLVLIIAIISYINLTLAQGGSRGNEVALRRLWGSSRLAIVRRLWFESLLLIFLSTLLAVFGMFALEPVFDRLFDTHLYLARHISLTLILLLIGFMLLLSIVCAALPAWFISRFRPIEVVSGKFRRVVKSSFSQIMVISQYAITMILLSCTMVMAVQIDYMTNSDMGYDYRNKLIIDVFGLDPQIVSTMRTEIAKIPGITGIGLTRGTPLNGGNNNSSEYRGRPLSMQIFSIDSVAMSLFDLKMKPNGRKADKPDRTLYLSRSAYNDFDVANLPDGVIHWGKAGEFYYCGDAPEVHFGGFKEPHPSYLFIPYPQSSAWSWSVLVGYSEGADPEQLIQSIQAVYSRITGQPYTEILRSEDIIASHSEEERSLSGFLLLFSILALVGTVMSVFAMAALRIRHKQKEIAIRKVVGAREVQILQIIGRRSLWNLLIAFAVASPASYLVMNRWLQGYTYHADMPWWVFPASLLFVSAVAMLSMLSMAMNAASSNPVDYLKNE